MTVLYLVRHGQASFGADDYDKLSQDGWQQARWLGEYFAARGLRFARATRGSLRRHDETLQGIEEGFAAHAGQPLLQAPALVLPGLNEYDTRPVLRAKLGDIDEKALSQDRKAYFRLLREALIGWAKGELLPTGEQSYGVFRGQLMAAFDQACSAPTDLPVLVVSSGGPISNIVGSLLQVPLEITIDLNLQTRNASFSEIAFSAQGRRLMSFNNIPHLDTAARAAFVTYS
jgi:broad specificity phosphatase PhoE